MRRFWKVLGVIGVVLLLVVTAAVTYGVWTVRRSFPQVSGTVTVQGLKGAVDVARDELGVPQIYADSAEDLYFAQGYVHAQDRFWEMDFRRHLTSGRLSEMFGKSSLDNDKFLRTLGWRRVAEQEYRMVNETSRMMLDSYAKGVNAYISGRSKNELSLEYAVLSLQNSGYTIEPWDPVDSLAWLKALAFQLVGNYDDEVTRALISADVSTSSAGASIARTEQLYPPYPFATHQPIVTTGAVVGGAFDPAASPQAQAASAVPTVPVGARAALRAAGLQSKALQQVLGPIGDGIGSNSWVVGGSHTQTGKPLLANDPHLAPAMPSLWYQAGLHCRSITPGCRTDVTGWTLAALPGVLIGHNERVAWGLTNLGPDVSDLYLEKVTGSTYLVDGQQRPLTVRDEVIKVANADPVTITVRSTDHGPIISDVSSSAETAGQDAPVPAPGQAATKAAPPPRGDGYQVALRWTALTPEPTFDAFHVINTARNFDDFRKAAKLLTVPSQNLVYADVDGNIGYQAPGIIPIRSNYNGKWPVPGWDSRYDWTGSIPFEALPYSYNPKEDWVSASNQAVIDTRTYPYFITDDWSYGARSQRILDRITELTAGGRKTSLAEMQQLQMDAWNEIAAFLAPKIRGSQGLDGDAAKAVALFDGWDFQQPATSAPGAYFNAFYRQLLNRMFDSKFSDSAAFANRSDRYWQVIRDLWDVPTDAWWDDGTTEGTTESRDQTVTNSLNAAAAELVSSQGGDPSSWQWGRMHTLTLTNQSLGQSGVKPVEWLFNRGEYRLGGGGSIVLATGWTPSKGYGVNWVPSMRQVVDLSNLDASTYVNLTGASGHAFNTNYKDQADAWVQGRQFAWPFTKAAVDAATEHLLTLQPGG